MFLTHPTIGHDCTYEELKRGLITVKTIEKGKTRSN